MKFLKNIFCNRLTIIVVLLFSILFYFLFDFALKHQFVRKDGPLTIELMLSQKSNLDITGSKCMCVSECEEYNSKTLKKLCYLKNIK